MGGPASRREFHSTLPAAAFVLVQRRHSEQITAEELEQETWTPKRRVAFWRGYQGWLLDRGISLYDLRIVCDFIRIERWYPPPVATTPATFPFATRLDITESEPLGRGVEVMSGYAVLYCL